jgi:hypothetical protein
VYDAERLSDPAKRRVVGGRVIAGFADWASQMVV